MFFSKNTAVKILDEILKIMIRILIREEDTV